MKRRAMLGALACLGALSSTPAFGERIVVIVGNNYFNPPEVFILPGDVVDWQNVAGFHSTTSDDGLWDSGAMRSPWDFQVQFGNTGDYHYYCSVHGGPGGIGQAGIVHVIHPLLEPPSETDPDGSAPVGVLAVDGVSFNPAIEAPEPRR
jgi:plastocyanin